jgi:hypothetical protein
MRSSDSRFGPASTRGSRRRRRPSTRLAPCRSGCRGPALWNTAKIVSGSPTIGSRLRAGGCLQPAASRCRAADSGLQATRATNGRTCPTAPPAAPRPGSTARPVLPPAAPPRSPPPRTACAAASNRAAAPATPRTPGTAPAAAGPARSPRPARPDPAPPRTPTAPAALRTPAPGTAAGCGPASASRYPYGGLPPRYRPCSRVCAAIAVRTRMLVRVISRLDDSPSTAIVFSSCTEA